MYFHYDVTEQIKAALGKTASMDAVFYLVSGGAVTFDPARTRLCVIFDNANVDVVEDNPAEYNSTTKAKVNATDSAYMEFPTRTLESLADFTAKTTLENRSLYAGNKAKSKYTATGKYYVVKNSSGRYTMVDPLGYEYYGIGLSNISQGSTDAELSAIYEKYPTYNADAAVTQWGKDTAKELRQLGFAEAGWSSYNKLTASTSKSDNLPQIININLMTQYLKTKIAEDSSLEFTTDRNTLTVGNDTLYIFEPDFEEFCDLYFSTLRDTLPADGYFVGLSSDNELPSSHKLLDKYLALDSSLRINRYSHEVATEWFKEYTGMKNVNTAYITDVMREDFKEFVYDRYYSVVSSCMKKYFPATIYFGARNKYSGYESSGIMKATGRYCDAIAINYYKVWTPDSYTMAEISGWSNKPFIVTEFYAKGMDTGFSNADGWGWVCPTQSDRAAFYQNYALKLLECKNCIGFNWFKYRDDADSNKGLYKMNLEIYEELAESIKGITYNVYDLMAYFD